MRPINVAIFGFVYIIIWISSGYVLAKSDRVTPHRFALFFSLGLGILKLSISLFLLPSPEAIIIGSFLFLIALVIGYPIAYFLFKRRMQKFK